MPLGIAKHVWSIGELIDAALAVSAAAIHDNPRRSHLELVYHQKSLQRLLK
jgi:hypothetical protein